MRISGAPPSTRSEGSFLVRGVALLLAVVLAAGCTTAGGGFTAAPTASSAGQAVASVSPATSPPAPSPSPSASAVPHTWPLTLTDDEQNVVTLAAEPKRIVSLTPATTEIVYALGAGSRLIAGTDADDYPAKAMELPHVATYSSVDVEKIVGLNADLVIAGGNNFNKPEALAQLRRGRIPRPGG